MSARRRRTTRTSRRSAPRISTEAPSRSSAAAASRRRRAGGSRPRRSRSPRPTTPRSPPGSRAQTLPDRLALAREGPRPPYGENPHQRAAFYTQRGAHPRAKQLPGQPLSFNNLLDLARPAAPARAGRASADRQARQPVRRRQSRTLCEAYERASRRPALRLRRHCRVRAPGGRRLARGWPSIRRVCSRPATTRGALAASGGARDPGPGGPRGGATALSRRAVPGGLLVQEPDLGREESIQVVPAAPTDQE